MSPKEENWKKSIKNIGKLFILTKDVKFDKEIILKEKILSHWLLGVHRLKMFHR